MGVDRDGSKNGRYVGGFFNLFDWKAKSRKKLFSSKSEIPENTKQGKRNDGNLPTTRVYMMDEDEVGMVVNARGHSDYSCASSVTDEEGCGSSKGPNVVASLMGLDSMPGSSSEPYSAPFFDTQSLRNTQVHNQRRDVNFSQNYQAMYSGDLIHRTPKPVRNSMELKSQRILNRPIEKFQSEILPHKSAKTIPVTQHKLLSPIKCPGFVHSRNAADIMEAAAKIIESAPHQSMKSKLPSSSFGHIKVGDFRSKEEIPSKGPSLRLRDLREKVETIQKSSKLQESSKRVSESEFTTAKYLRGQSLSKSYNGGGSSSFRAYAENNSGKSVSLAVQAKVNVQKREGLSLSDRNGSFQQEQSESKLKRHHKKKSPALNNSGVLRQNNQKQNCSADKEKLPSKSMARKSLLDSSIRAKSSTSSKSNGSSGSGTKSGSRKLDVLDGDKEISQSNMRNFPRKKRSISGGFQNKVSDDFLHKKQSVVQKNWIEDSKNNGMDVVSFTFTAPLSQKSNSFDHQWGKGVMSETDSMKLSSLGYNVIGGDALSKLLEQKLKELSYEVSSSSCNASASVGSNSTAPPSTLQEPDTVNSKPRLTAKRGHDLLLENTKLGADSHTDLFSRNPPLHRLRQQCQGTDDMEVDVKNSLDFRNPSPVSVLEQSFVSESWISSESMESNWIEGKSTNQAAEVLGARNPCSIKTDMDLSDSASSLSTGRTIKSLAPKSTNWELEYVQEMLFNAEPMYKDFTLGLTSTMIPPHLFQQLEDRIMETDDGFKRKMLFDCVSESIEKRFKRFVGGGSHAWGIGLETARSKERLAEEVNREIKGLRGMVDCMVDDLVDKDMGSHCGKWLEFDAEGFEVGVGIEGEILSSLVDEAIAGILRL